MIDEKQMQQFEKDMIELSRKLKARGGKSSGESNLMTSLNCLVLTLVLAGGLLLFSLSVAVWVNWII